MYWYTSLIMELFLVFFVRKNDNFNELMFQLSHGKFQFLFILWTWKFTSFRIWVKSWKYTFHSFSLLGKNIQFQWCFTRIMEIYIFIILCWHKNFNSFPFCVDLEIYMYWNMSSNKKSTFFAFVWNENWKFQLIDDSAES